MKVNGVRMLLTIALALGAFVAPAWASSLMAVQPDGKIVVGGKAAPDSGFVARLTPDGKLDPAFGREGIVLGRRLPPVDTLAVQPDGRIIVAAGPWLVRYEADGQIDRSFEGPDASAGFSYRYDSVVPLPNSLIAVARHRTNLAKLILPSADVDLLAPSGQLAWQLERIGPHPTFLPSDMILVGGRLILSGFEFGGSSQSALVRFTLGSYHYDDRTFGDGDGYGAGGPAAVRDFEAVASHDRMLYASGSTGPGGSTGDEVALTRFTSDGELDSEFGVEGLATANRGLAFFNGMDLAVQPDGRVLVAAEGGHCPGCSRSWLTRFTASGELDTSFGDDGLAYARDAAGTPLTSHGKGVVLLPGGRSLVLGTGPEHGVVLAAFNSNGNPDRSWGAGGVQTISPTCAGDMAAQRASGCLPAARAKLRVRHLRGGRSILDLDVGVERPWSEIASVRLLLPRALRIRKRAARRIVARAHSGDSTGKAGLKSGRRGVKISANDAQRVRLRIPRNALRRVNARRGKRRLPFRVAVVFANGEGSQRLVLRRAG
jgi:uncharacterized delta-60 repeat protein